MRPSDPRGAPIQVWGSNHNTYLAVDLVHVVLIAQKELADALGGVSNEFQESIKQGIPISTELAQ